MTLVIVTFALAVAIGPSVGFVAGAMWATVHRAARQADDV